LTDHASILCLPDNEARSRSKLIQPRFRKVLKKALNTGVVAIFDIHHELQEGNVVYNVSAAVTIAEPIRVMHVIDKLGVGGSSVHGITQLLAQSMPMFDSGQFEFTVCSLRAPEPAGDVLKKAGVRLEYLSRSKFDPRTLSDLLALVKRKSHEYCTCTALGRPVSAALSVGSPEYPISFTSIWSSFASRSI
jgi:hypothetical protein